MLTGACLHDARQEELTKTREEATTARAEGRRGQAEAEFERSRSNRLDSQLNEQSKNADALMQSSARYQVPAQCPSALQHAAVGKAKKFLIETMQHRPDLPLIHANCCCLSCMHLHDKLFAMGRQLAASFGMLSSGGPSHSCPRSSSDMIMGDRERGLKLKRWLAGAGHRSAY